MLNHRDIVMTAGEEPGYRSGKSTEPVHQRWHLTHHSMCIARGSGEQIFAMMREIEHQNIAMHRRGKQHCGVGRPGLSKDDDVDLMAARQIFEN